MRVPFLLFVGMFFSSYVRKKKAKGEERKGKGRHNLRPATEKQKTMFI